MIIYRKIFKSAASLAGLAFLLAACTSGIIYDETVEFGSTGWHMDNPAVFAIDIQDTSRVYDVGFTFRHNDDYAFSNLWLFLTVSGPGDLNMKDTLELFIAQNDGRWLGKSRHGGFEISALYQHDVKLAKPGEYVFSVTHGMRRALLPDIESVEFWIQEGQ